MHTNAHAYLSIIKCSKRTHICMYRVWNDSCVLKLSSAKIAFDMYHKFARVHTTQIRISSQEKCFYNLGVCSFTKKDYHHRQFRTFACGNNPHNSNEDRRSRKWIDRCVRKGFSRSRNGSCLSFTMVNSISISQYPLITGKQVKNSLRF